MKGKKEMKIAVACENNRVCQHFGYAPEFAVVEVSDKEIEKVDYVKNPGHKKGFLPGFLHDLGAEVVIAGGMGEGAVGLFNELNIKAVLGAQGLVLDVVKAYLDKTLVTNDTVCHQHQHHGNC
jgi:predicted Fe-Mo cluster-binding NifX family protein